MSKDRARPFSRKHRKYWIPVTGGMILIGVINVAIGFCTYTPPSNLRERIEFDVPHVGGGAGGSASARPVTATGCAPEVSARIAAELPGAVIVACTPARFTVVRDGKTLELELAGSEIQGIAEPLTLPEIPAAVMRAFAIAHPRTIPAGAIKRTRRGAEPVYELAFPPGGAHTTATLRGDGTVVELR